MEFTHVITDPFIEQITQHWHAFLIAALVGMMTGFLALKNNFFNWGAQPIKFTFIRGKDVLKAFICFIVFSILLPSIASVFFSFFIGGAKEVAWANSSVQGWMNVLTVLGGAIGVALVFFMLPSYERHAMWGSFRFGYKNFCLGCLTWFISYPVVMALSQLIAIFTLFFFQQTPIDQEAVKYFRSIMYDPILIWVTAFLVIGVVPVTEELLFRGFLQNWLKAKMKSPKKAIFLTSLVFAFFHFSISQGITNIELIAALFVLSCFLGFLYERQQSLLASIGLHVTFNALTILMILFEK